MRTPNSAQHDLPNGAFNYKASDNMLF